MAAKPGTVIHEKDAKRDIGKLFNDARKRGPQVVITDGGGEVVIIAKERFDRMRLTPQDYAWTSW